jgi:threonine dehydrogenase-like Zn-dependent dehydrogenase
VQALHPLPDRLSWDEGAFCDNIGIALYALERMQRLGGMADAAVVATGDAPLPQIRAALQAEAADLVVEFAGTAEAARQAIQLARRGSRVVLAGATGPGKELSGIDLSTIVRGHLDIYGSLANPRGISGRGLELSARGVVHVKPLITHRFAFEDFVEAWTTFVERRDGAIRVILHP